MNSGFCYKADENSNFLVYYTVSSGNFIVHFGKTYGTHLQESHENSTDRLS